MNSSRRSCVFMEAAVQGGRICSSLFLWGNWIWFWNFSLLCVLPSQSNTCKNQYYTTLSIKLDMFRGPVSNQIVLGLNIEIRVVVLSAEQYFSKINSRDFLPFDGLQHVVLQKFQALKAEQSLWLEWHLPNGFSVTDTEIHPCCISLSLILISFVTLCIEVFLLYWCLLREKDVHLSHFGYLYCEEYILEEEVALK